MEILFPDTEMEVVAAEWKLNLCYWILIKMNFSTVEFGSECLVERFLWISDILRLIKKDYVTGLSCEQINVQSEQFSIKFPQSVRA